MTAQLKDRPWCEVMLKIVALAEASLRIPVGRWDTRIGGGWRLRVNGSAEPWDRLPPWSAMIDDGGFRIAVVDTFGGRMVGIDEDELIGVIEAATAVMMDSRRDGISSARRGGHG